MFKLFQKYQDHTYITRTIFCIPLFKITNSCPGEVISEAYELEYGKDRLEMHVGAIQRGDRALVIDDLVATGGTLSAATRLLGKILKSFHYPITFCM